MANFKKQCSIFILITICLVTWHTPSEAITLKEEKQLSQEFMRVVHHYYSLIDDPLINEYINSIGQKILKQVPQQPFEYKFHVIQEDVYNAFAIPAGYIFINSGLLLAMESEDELAGILAHEISHVVCRHISQRIEKSKKIDLASLAGLVAGVFLGSASGNLEAAQALTFGSLAAGQTLALAYSRENEAQADHLGLVYLNKAGYSAQGLLKILKKIRSKQWFGSNQIPTYVMTHPAVEDRIVAIDSWMATNADVNIVLHTNKQFKRMQFRVRALSKNIEDAIDFFQSGLKSNPMDVEYAYGMGLTLARKKRYNEAATYLQQALTQNALDPAILSDLGRIYFLDGRPKEALPLLKGATSLNGPNIEGWFYLGRTHLTVGDFSAAAADFEKVLQKQDNYTPAYYYLGETYGKLGKKPEMHYYLGMFHFYKGEERTASYHLLRAQKEITDPTKKESIKQVFKIIKTKPKAEE